MLEAPPADSVSTSVAREQVDLPRAPFLAQDYPNPLNSSAVVRFVLSGREGVELTVHNLAGQRVAALLVGQRDAGEHTVRWDGRDDAGRPLASGVYLYLLRAGSHTDARKLVILR